MTAATGHQHRPSTRIEWRLLDLLLERGTLSVGELVDAIGSAAIVAEAIQALQAAGLVEQRGASVHLAG
jgi:predicted transcriptional regulator